MIQSNEAAGGLAGSPADLAPTPGDGPSTLTVPDFVRRQVAATPDATALRFGSQIVSYAELAAGSASLASHLRRLGVRRDDAVGICLSRSPAMVHGALGVMTAGAAYLPLDPAHPTARLIATLEDAGARIVLTDRTHRSRFDGLPLTTILVDDLLSVAPDGLDAPAGDARSPSPDDLAYVIYTSGSTGRPKGVDITHRSLLNLVRWHQEAFSVSADDRATALAGPAFDAVVWELWPYLTIGASVVIADEDTRLSAAAVRDWLIAEGVTITFLPTPLAEAAMRLDWPADTTLRILLTGADSLHTYPPAGLPFALVNNYGPTECTVVATSGRIFPTPDNDALPSIGRPILNVQIHLLDEDGRPVAANEFGEIYIGGEGVARGYRNHPELTAERFVPDSFSARPGGRLYRTGDLARLRDNGTIEFGGRVDGQVKIRGNRVEPEEVARNLDQHPDVQTSCVIAMTDADGEKRLVAYVVAAPGRGPARTELTAFLRDRLPDYMIPADVIRISALPLTANGKVDRVALLAAPTIREPERSADGSAAATGPGAAYVAPSTTVERRIAELTSVLLKLERVSVEDDFFLLGGHSLLATQLIVRTREAFGVEIPLRTIFEQPTVRQLAVVVEDRLLEQMEAASGEPKESVV